MVGKACFSAAAYTAHMVSRLHLVSLSPRALWLSAISAAFLALIATGGTAYV
jgi:hypothetical protein